MSFKDLACLSEKLSSTTKRTEMVSLAADFLKDLDPKEVEPAVFMLLGRPFTRTSDEQLDISGATLYSLVLRITGAGPKNMDKALSNSADFGDATANLFKSRKAKSQQLFAEKPLDILGVQETLKAIAKVKGARSRQKKERLLEGLLNS